MTKDKIILREENISLSILILTRDRKEELNKLIGSIRNLNTANNNEFEILIFDNGSKNKLTIQKLQKIGFVKNIRLLNSNKNIGLAAGRNLLARESKGKWLFFIDDDAFIPDDEFLRIFINFVKNFENDKLAVIACNVIECYKPWKNIYPFSRRILKKLDLKTPIKCSYFLGGAHFIRREIFLKLNGYDGNLFFWGEELDFSYKLINKGYEIFFHPDLLVIHKKSKIKNLDKNIEHLYFLRNKIYINYKYLPWYFRWISNLIWVSNYLMRTKNVPLVIKAVIEGVKLCKCAKREILTKDAIKYLWHNYGRLFY